MRRAWLIVLLASACDHPLAPADTPLDVVSPAPPVSAPSALEGAEYTQSPWPSTDGTARETALAASCGEPDAALGRVARALAARRARGAGVPDPDAVTAMLRAEGEPHLHPRYVLRVDHAPADDARVALRIRELGGPHARCAAAIEPAAPPARSGEVLAVVAVDALADLAALARRARVGEWLGVEARIHVPVHGARVYVMGARGLPRTVPSSLDGNLLRAKFSPDRAGAFTVQVVGDLDEGPKPLLEARVFAGVEPPDEDAPEPAPGEREGVDADALARMVQDARAATGLSSLARDPDLDALARAHALKMKERRAVAHDVGDGDLVARFDDDARVVGENVARAASVALAHRALWASPSHRMNVLRADYTHLGVGVAPPDAEGGDVYVCEVFAAR